MTQDQKKTKNVFVGVGASRTYRRRRVKLKFEYVRNSSNPDRNKFYLNKLKSNVWIRLICVLNLSYFILVIFIFPKGFQNSINQFSSIKVRLFEPGVGIGRPGPARQFSARTGMGPLMFSPIGLRKSSPIPARSVRAQPGPARFLNILFLQKFSFLVISNTYLSTQITLS